MSTFCICMVEDDNLKQFIKELTALSLKYKLIIGGCGCCGSPYITPLTDDDLPGKYLSDIGKQITLEWKKHCELFVIIQEH